jgi:hypothetical protein
VEGRRDGQNPAHSAYGAVEGKFADDRRLVPLDGDDLAGGNQNSQSDGQVEESRDWVDSLSINETKKDTVRCPFYLS